MLSCYPSLVYDSINNSLEPSDPLSCFHVLLSHPEGRDKHYMEMAGSLSESAVKISSFYK
ncbi:MAG: hypothetical protein D3922_01840 [Candidatus Electrothrix sp. AR1]|nr:hypothetical protein [Candidatus Electrothrix sp. AR1]